jgi:hypothetical protein
MVFLSAAALHQHPRKPVLRVLIGIPKRIHAQTSVPGMFSVPYSVQPGIPSSKLVATERLLLISSHCRLFGLQYYQRMNKVEFVAN